MTTQTLPKKIADADLPQTVLGLKMAVQFDKPPDIRFMIVPLLMWNERWSIFLSCLHVFFSLWLIHILPKSIGVLIGFVVLFVFMLFGTLLTMKPVPEMQSRPKRMETKKSSLPLQLIYVIGYPMVVVLFIVVRARNEKRKFPELKKDARRRQLVDISDAIDRWNEMIDAFAKKCGTEFAELSANDRTDLLRLEQTLWYVIRETHSHLVHYPLAVPLDHVPEEIKKIDQERDLFDCELMDYRDALSDEDEA